MSKKKQSILIVDDEKKNLDLLEAFLTPHGYEVIKAVSGESCLDTLNNRKDIGLALLDVMMPGKDGYAVCREIKENEETKFLPVVMVTSLGEKDDKIRSIDAGADDFLTKPVDKHELSARVKSLLRIKTLHDDLEKSYEDLKRVEQLKEDLSKMVAHDMGNILTGISVSLELMADEEDLSPEIRDDLVQAQSSSSELLELSSNLIDISKMEEEKLQLEMEGIDLTDIISQCVDKLIYVARQNKIQIKPIDKDKPAVVRADRIIIRRVITNLLNNALKYAGQGGTVTVQTVKKETEEGGYIEVSVADTGIGIPEEFHQKIFEKYSQIDTKLEGIRRGKGLGLTFCKLAVEAHGGKIRVESESEKGSRFSFYFTPLEIMNYTRAKK
ncbi:MAG: hybrid sensor histidine kinase/response regulator [Elusimicrobiota bacterium]